MSKLDVKQDQLIEDYGFIEDPAERFQVIVDSAGSGENFPKDCEQDIYLVEGCTSRVWVVGQILEDGTFELHIKSEAPALHGIGKLLTDLYSGEDPTEVVETEPRFVEALQLDRSLSPTRLRGLGNIRKQIVDFASGRRSL